MKAKDLLKILKSRPKDLPVYIECYWKLNDMETRGYMPLQSITGTNKGHLLENGVDPRRVLTVRNIMDYFKIEFRPDQRLDWKICVTTIDIGSKTSIKYPEVNLRATLSSIKKARGRGYYVMNPKGKRKALFLTEVTDD